MINEVEFSPVCCQSALVKACSDRGVAVVGYSPYGTCWMSAFMGHCHKVPWHGEDTNLLGHEAVRAVAAEVGATPAQVLPPLLAAARRRRHRTRRRRSRSARRERRRQELTCARHLPPAPDGAPRRAQPDRHAPRHLVVGRRSLLGSSPRPRGRSRAGGRRRSTSSPWHHVIVATFGAHADMTRAQSVRSSPASGSEVPLPRAAGAAHRPARSTPRSTSSCPTTACSRAASRRRRCASAARGGARRRCARKARTSRRRATSSTAGTRRSTSTTLRSRAITSTATLL